MPESKISLRGMIFDMPSHSSIHAEQIRDVETKNFYAGWRPLVEFIDDRLELLEINGILVHKDQPDDDNITH